MRESDRNCINPFGKDYILEQEIRLIITLQKGKITGKRMRKMLKLLESLEEIRRMRTNFDKIYEGKITERTTFLPGGTVFYNRVEMKDGKIKPDKESLRPCDAQNSMRSFLPGSGLVFHHDHSK